MRRCHRCRRHIVVWGTGKVSREFIYVEDAAEGILLAAERYNGPQPVNIGAGFEITIRDLVDKIVKLTGFKGQIRWDTSNPDGQPRRRLDVSRAKQLFGFEAQMTFDEGLKRTIDWFRKPATQSLDSYFACFGSVETKLTSIASSIRFSSVRPQDF
jgi:GDP-L-fucose synthase